MPEDTTQQQLEQPTFPMTQYAILPEGVRFNVVISPEFAHTLFIQAQAMDHVAGQWLEHREQEKRQQAETMAVMAEQPAPIPMKKRGKK